MDNAKIKAALRVLDGLPGEVRFRSDDWTMWRTCLTVAELRELLEAARDGAWRDAEADPPKGNRPFLCELDGGSITVGIYVPKWGRWSLCCDDLCVRRWRELPR